MKLDILAFGAHPDDVELSCAGTIIKAVNSGKKVGVIDLTMGELGTRGSAKIRAEETSKASQIMGIDVRENLGLADGFFSNNKESQKLVIQKIRQYQPSIVLCNAVEDRHIDHPRASQLITDACFLSGLVKIQTSDPNSSDNQNPWRPKQVYHYIQWKTLTPDFVVDISAQMDKKMAVIKAYQSQFFNSNSNEPETPISTKNFMDSVKYRSRDLGRLVGVDFAEGFTTERLPLVDSIFDLK